MPSEKELKFQDVDPSKPFLGPKAPEAVVNTANIAASTRLGGPGSIGYEKQVEGPKTEKLDAPIKLLMSHRPALEQRQNEDGSMTDLMATLHTKEGEIDYNAGIVRLEDGSYAIATTDQEGIAQLTMLDEFDRTTSFALGSAEVRVSFRQINSDLSISPANIAHPADVDVTFNN